jgi:hypothetical protein
MELISYVLIQYFIKCLTKIYLSNVISIAVRHFQSYTFFLFLSVVLLSWIWNSVTQSYKIAMARLNSSDCQDYCGLLLSHLV